MYHGNPTGSASEANDYNQGVREGAVGLLLNSVRALSFHLALFLGSPSLTTQFVLFFELAYWELYRE